MVLVCVLWARQGEPREPGSKSWRFSFFFHEIGKILQNFLKVTSPESSSHIVTP